ncbi:uncharacterized protein FIESC28_00658 [Fusarium coffeatum]|uniref:Ecp2 effector protein domain-containing protein n=1 Tax=Fusarium coffeatum TaxID=231269 RepID=A0A366SB33_9HYPO|nr:uncharacterized protein FIESC28_00658 [Fusarium coffeatum]RBR26541.1 hypothetical protein FIESC28_00658 [Fusarium coffeatum]
MFTKFATIIAATSVLASAVSYPRGESGFASITPHDMYESSVGVLGCKIDTNRVAYWPSSVDCNNICVRVSNEGRSVYLLKIGSSSSAHDISYDAWNYLGFGSSATKDPHMDGGIAMNYEYVHASKCRDILDNGKLPLAAANSMNYVTSCLRDPKSWVAQNYQLYNIHDSVCKHGVDEKCHLNLDVSNQPECPSGLGSQKELNMNVENIMYGTGEKAAAL